MSKSNERVLAALVALGAVYLRTRSHDIYRLPNGRIFTLCRDYGDPHAEQNALATLRQRADVPRHHVDDGQRCAHVHVAKTPDYTINLAPCLHCSRCGRFVRPDDWGKTCKGMV